MGCICIQEAHDGCSGFRRGTVSFSHHIGWHLLTSSSLPPPLSHVGVGFSPPLAVSRSCSSWKPWVCHLPSLNVILHYRWALRFSPAPGAWVSLTCFQAMHPRPQASGLLSSDPAPQSSSLPIPSLSPVFLCSDARLWIRALPDVPCTHL